MNAIQRFPLDLAQVGYSYVERPNNVLLDLLADHALNANPRGRILDVGCGAGANARALRKRFPQATIVGIEPNAQAAALAREVCDEVITGDAQGWMASETQAPFDAVVLSDVLEHIADPVRFLRELTGVAALQKSLWVISVPNYAVWYNRLFTLLGRFDYAWSGLYDRTHLRFYTRRSLLQLLNNLHLGRVDVRCSPAIVQSAAPLLRRFFERDVAKGDHLSLPRSRAYQVYERVVEPIEQKVCSLWPELLGFQIIVAAKLESSS